MMRGGPRGKPVVPEVVMEFVSCEDFSLKRQVHGESLTWPPSESTGATRQHAQKARVECPCGRLCRGKRNRHNTQLCSNRLVTEAGLPAEGTAGLHERLVVPPRQGFPQRADGNRGLRLVRRGVSALRSAQNASGEAASPSRRSHFNLWLLASARSGSIGIGAQGLQAPKGTAGCISSGAEVRWGEVLSDDAPPRNIHCVNHPDSGLGARDPLQVWE